MKKVIFKKIFALIFVLFLLSSFVFPTFAAEKIIGEEETVNGFTIQQLIN